MRLHNFKKNDPVPQWIYSCETLEGKEVNAIIFGVDVVVERRKKTDPFPVWVFPEQERKEEDWIIDATNLPKGQKYTIKGAPTKISLYPRGHPANTGNYIIDEQKAKNIIRDAVNEVLKLPDVPQKGGE